MGRGVIQLQLGNYRAAIEALGPGWDAHRVTGANLGASYFLSELARAWGMNGNFRDAFRLLDEVVVDLKRTGERAWEPQVYLCYAELCAAAQPSEPLSLPLPSTVTSADADPVEAWLLEALHSSRRSGAMAYSLRAATRLGRHRLLHGDPVEARELLLDVLQHLPAETDLKNRQDADDVIADIERATAARPARAGA